MTGACSDGRRRAAAGRTTSCWPGSASSKPALGADPDRVAGREHREHRVGEARRQPLDAQRVVHPSEPAPRADRDPALPGDDRVHPAVGQTRATRRAGPPGHRRSRSARARGRSRPRAPTPAPPAAGPGRRGGRWRAGPAGSGSRSSSRSTKVSAASAWGVRSVAAHTPSGQPNTAPTTGDAQPERQALGERRRRRRGTAGRRRTCPDTSRGCRTSGPPRCSAPCQPRIEEDLRRVRLQRRDWRGARRRSGAGATGAPGARPGRRRKPAARQQLASRGGCGGRDPCVGSSASNAIVCTPSATAPLVPELELGLEVDPAVRRARATGSCRADPPATRTPVRAVAGSGGS